MQFMLMIIADETRPIPPPAQLATLQAAYGAFAHSLVKTGQLKGAVRLEQSLLAGNVRLQAGKPVASSGPVTPGKDQPAGYYLVECANLEEALGIAARIPGVALGETVEVRQVAPMPGPPAI